jgi:solute carrier family 26, other
LTSCLQSDKMSQKTMNNNMIQIEDQNDYKILPYSVTRKVLKQDELEEIAGYDRHKDTATENFRDGLKNFDFKGLIYDSCPVIRWLPEYQVHKNLMGDVISGITVAVMHIPQGMAYGLLAGVDPIVGLYMAFFPTLIYFLFGTSRHISMGTFAVISLMTSKIVATYSDPNHGQPALNLTAIESEIGGYTYTPFQVATAVTMMTGFYQLIMCILRLGALSSLLSEALVNGFTTAAGRVKKLFGKT